MHPGHRPRGPALALTAALTAAFATAKHPTVGAQQRATQPARPPAQPAPDAPDLAGLRAAFLSGAADDIARAGQRLSARRLADALMGRDRELALAAASAAPAAADGVWLLAPLGELARSPDRPLAAAGARAAAHIAGGLVLDTLLELDVPLDWLRARLADYRAQAVD